MIAPAPLMRKLKLRDRRELRRARSAGTTDPGPRSPEPTLSAIPVTPGPLPAALMGTEQTQHRSDPRAPHL